MPTLRCYLLACTLLPAISLAAPPLDPADVPAPLRPWIDWVTFENTDIGCPFFYNNSKARRCAWPGKLQLNLRTEGGRFSAEWEVYADSWITLPGDHKYWPQGVKLDGRATVTVDRSSKPTLHVGPGKHKIEGQFLWDRVPESLTIPAASGLVRLTVNDLDVPQPEVDRNGQIWLRDLEAGKGKAQDEEKNKVTLVVLRRIIDDNPMELHTRLEFDVTGDQREQIIGQPLPPGFIPTYIKGPLPARLDPDGSLAVQLRPGRHVITVGARHPEPLVNLTSAAQEAPWPRDETWVFEARNHLRVVEIEGVQSIDPRQTRAPQDYHKLPAFMVNAGDEMRLLVVRRGNPDPEPDKLNLVRDLWLDFDGEAYTVRDQITGQVTRNWRLDSGDRLQLGQVLIDRKPQFITQLDSGSAEGIEVRRGKVNLRADGRMTEHIDRFAASGWAHDFQSAQATLNLPPGWDIFSIGGVDNIPETWLTRWTLLDLFLVLVISAAVSRLWGLRGATVAVVAIALIWHAPDAPRYVWIHLLIAIALLRVLPAGRLRWMVGSYRNVTALILILICIPFVIQELRLAVYPQLAQPHRYTPATAASPSQSIVAAEEVATLAMDARTDDFAMADEIRLEAPAEMVAGAMSKRGRTMRSSKAPARKASTLYRADPDAIVQTGPGLPSWKWRQVKLGWNGPVDQTQQLSINYIPPALNRGLHVARVVLLIAFLLVVAGLKLTQVVAIARRGSIATSVLIAAGVAGYAVDLRADGFPEPAMLQELKQRLLAPPECARHCADITRMHINVSADAIAFRLEIHAAEATAIPLPGNARGWLADTVLLDQAQTTALFRDTRGTLWLQIPPGVHDVILRGALPQRSRVQIALPLRPRFTELASVELWGVEGLRDDGLVEAQLQLTRVQKGAAPVQQDPFEHAELPPFVRVERTIDLGLDWSVTTRIVRVVGGDSAVVLKVPLLTGESVITAGIEVEDGAVLVNMPRGQGSIGWRSVLSKIDTIALTAPTTTSWSETWRLRAGPIWHARLAGIAPVHHRGEGDRWLPEWRPWPGESISIAVVRPQGISGQTMTIDSSVIHVKPGKRATETTLDIGLRSSKGGQYSMTLPSEAVLQDVKLNGVPQPIRVEQGVLTVPITPGAQQIAIAWRHNAGVASVFRTPSVDLTMPSINHEIKLSLGDDRWTLLTVGPLLGPAVRFWSLLATLLIVALALARVRITPLRTHEWLLLVIGLSQVAIPLAAVVVIWLLALGLRERFPDRLERARFNFMQIVLVFLTIAAFMVLIEAIRHGLLGHPDMHVAGNGSSAHQLLWYADRIAPAPPTAMAITVPILVYRLLMLAWALWLALAIVRWLRWGWSCFAKGGLWQRWKKPKGEVAPPEPEPEPAT